MSREKERTDADELNELLATSDDASSGLQEQDILRQREQVFQLANARIPVPAHLEVYRDQRVRFKTSGVMGTVYGFTRDQKLRVITDDSTKHVPVEPSSVFIIKPQGEVEARKEAA
jgi:hypothetical protein